MGKVMITGGSRGIGKSMAKEFLKKNYDVILVARDKNQLEETKLELEHEYKNNIIYIEVMDLILNENINKLFQKYSDVDIVVNNAATLNLGNSFDIEDSLFVNGLKLNVEIPCIISNHYIKQMINKKINNINMIGVINVSSISGIIPHSLTTFYSPSKFFLDQYTINMNYELKRSNNIDMKINIMSLCPGSVDTEFTGENKFLKLKKICRNFKFLNIMMTPDYVAKVAVNDFFKGKNRSIPGLLYKVTSFICKFIPNKIIYKSMYNTLKKEI